MIERFVRERGITAVLHFTRLENLRSIITHGLLSRSKLDERDIKYTFNDVQRLDDHPRASSLSISWPNYRMFYKYRINEQGSKWSVIAFKPDILWKIRCAFCRENAASAREKSIAASKKIGAEGLTVLFEEVNDGRPRAALKIPDNYPTNPQAEVLAFGEIPSSYIQEVFFDDKQIVSVASQEAPQIKCTYDRTYFGPRADYVHWGSSKIDKIKDITMTADDEIPF